MSITQNWKTEDSWRNDAETLRASLATCQKSHTLTQEGYTKLRSDYDSLHRQFTEQRDKLAAMETEKNTLNRNWREAWNESQARVRVLEEQIEAAKRCGDAIKIEHIGSTGLIDWDETKKNIDRAMLFHVVNNSDLQQQLSTLRESERRVKEALEEIANSKAPTWYTDYDGFRHWLDREDGSPGQKFSAWLVKHFQLAFEKAWSMLREKASQALKRA